MQTTAKRSSEKAKPKEKSKDVASSRKPKEEDVSKKVVATPRSYSQKPPTVDIYGQKKKNVVQITRAPKKVTGTTHASSNVTPTKDYLKSSPSSTSQLSVKSAYDKAPPKKPDLKNDSRTPLYSARKPRTAKDLPFSNVTVNSPVATRKLSSVVEQKPKKNNPLNYTPKKKETEIVKNASKNLERGDSIEIGDNRERSKTRTLDEKEVKVLKPDAVDNNAEMLNLSKRLTAKSKAFYVDIEDGNTKITEKASDSDLSYEDDFESYVSDFDSYHSDKTSKDNNTSENENEGSQDDNEGSENHDDQKENDSSNESEHFTEGSLKEGKDEERMLDSGNFDLRDRSAKNRPAAMEFIQEDNEDDKRTSLTDEGFQDMSSSSVVSVLKSHVDVLDRPLFIDFTKSKECKRKRKINQQLKQRAADLLSMITLHEMSYNLFEMKPIPYDLYMATFGRSNYSQIAVQTFDDGITEEVQTDEIFNEHKWTQFPIEFSKNDVYLYPDGKSEKYGKSNEDYLTKFSFLTDTNLDIEVNNKVNLDKDYQENPLKIYLEQKEGVGFCKMLPYESYKNKIEHNDYDAKKLSKFLKKVESCVSNVLSLNNSKNPIAFKNTVNQKIPLSKGYLTINSKSINSTENSFLKDAKINKVIFSDTKSHLLMLIHKKTTCGVENRCVICLCDISVVRKDPVKILVAIDNVSIGKFRGSTDGIFVAALDDGSLHLWDLSEEPTWRNEVANDKMPTDLEINTDRLSQTEIDREWNLKNVNVGKEENPLPYALQACAFTNSAANMVDADVTDHVVGLEFIGDKFSSARLEGRRKIVGQICTLQRVGILTIWSIVQEKTQTTDIGKAYWSKMKLEKTQTITLLDYIDLPTKVAKDEEILTNFNLNAAKRRLSNRKIEKTLIKKEINRPKSTSSSEFDISRPASAASLKRALSAEKKVHLSWESGILCSDLKIMRINKKESYLVGKNCGEVLCCTRIAGAVKVERFCVSNDTSSVTCLAVSSHGLPYFLAATDSGTVNFCSMIDSRVLLTLDCRNGPPSDSDDKCQSDSKGRFISSSKVRSLPNRLTEIKMDSKLPVIFLHWSSSNPCSLYTLLQDGTLSMWDLTHSDICAKSVSTQAVVTCAAGDGVLALLTSEGEVQVHRLTTDKHNIHHLDLFKKYVTLL